MHSELLTLMAQATLTTASCEQFPALRRHAPVTNRYGHSSMPCACDRPILAHLGFIRTFMLQSPCAPRSTQTALHACGSVQ